MWLPDYMLHMALQPLLWTLADESSLLCLRTLPRLHWVYSGWCTFFFSSTAKPAIFCSFSMPSLLPASTTPTLTPAAHWSMPSLKCCVQSSPQLMLRVSCCTLVERKYPPFHVCEVFFFLSARSQLLWSAYCSHPTHPKSCFEVHFCYNSGVMWVFVALILVIKFWFISKV